MARRPRRRGWGMSERRRWLNRISAVARAGHLCGPISPPTGLARLLRRYRGGGRAGTGRQRPGRHRGRRHAHHRGAHWRGVEPEPILRAGGVRRIYFTVDPFGALGSPGECGRDHGVRPQRIDDVGQRHFARDARGRQPGARVWRSVDSVCPAKWSRWRNRTPPSKDAPAATS